jgi:hypothetical protein
MRSEAVRLSERDQTRSLQALRCLVFNADFRPLSTYPLSIVDARDAVQAVFRERVSVIEAWPDAFLYYRNAGSTSLPNSSTVATGSVARLTVNMTRRSCATCAATI